MSPPDLIARLVQRFDDNRDAYRSGQYNEARLLQELPNTSFRREGSVYHGSNLDR